MATVNEDFNPGDPAVIIGGKVEQPARTHAPQKPKPTKTARGIAADIKHRIQEIEPQLDALVKEHAMLQRLDFILNQPAPTPEPKPKRKYTKRRASKPAAKKPAKR